MIRDEIRKIIQTVVGDEVEVRVEHPADSAMGDYATNVAFLLAKKKGESPKGIAEALTKEIAQKDEAKKMFEMVEPAGAGFINFKLSKDFLRKQLPYVGRPTSHIKEGGRGKLNIEFLSANPTGKFQVGNGRGAFYGDVLGNIFKLAGYEVTKEYYVNNTKSSNQIQELGKTALGKGEKYLTPHIKEKIKILFPPTHHKEEESEAGFKLAEAIHEDNKKFLKKIGIDFDIFTEEEDLYKKDLLGGTLKFLKEKNLVYEQDGAQWLRTTDFGDDKDEVVVRTDGEYGYFLGDIAYHWDKIKRGYNDIIDIFGADHQGHVLPMKIAMEILGYKGKFEVLVSQLVRAKGGGKFSKRAGNVILLEELVDEVGVDVARYFYLMKSLDTQMEFDMDLAREQSDKNPVYYIQYAHARMASILAKIPNSKFQIPNKIQNQNYKLLKHESELFLIKRILRWPEVVEDTANDYQVQRVAGYAYELANSFNGFYRDCRVISEDDNLTNARLNLVLITQHILKEVLGAMGISAPEKM